MMNNVSIKKMRVMLAVVEEGSFTKASARENISQPAATVIINDIEDQAGCDLFVRNGTSRNAVLTEAGEKVADIFSRIVAEYDYEICRLNTEVGGRRVQKEILVQDTFASCLSGTWLQSLFETFKGYEITVNTRARADILDRVHAREACLGIIDGHAAAEKSDYRHIASDKFIVVVQAPEHGASGHMRTHIGWDQLPKDCILYSGISAEPMKMLKERLQDGEGSGRNHLEVNNPALIAKLVRQTGMPAILPRATAASILDQDGLASLIPEGPSIHIPIGVVMPWGKMRSTKFESLRGENVFPGLFA